jgi:hypothetical protein
MSFSFLDLQNYARARCNIEQNQTVSDTTLQLYLNMSLGSMYNVITTDYEDYNMSKYLCTLSNNNQIPLPPDFMKLRAVDFGGPGFWTTVFGFNMQERNRQNNPIANMVTPYGNIAARKVRTMDNKIFVEPENLAMGQYQIWYTPKFKNLVLPTDLLPAAMDTNGWVEYAVCNTGVKVYNQMGLTQAALGFIEEMKYYETIVRNGAANRDDNGPQVVVNVSNISDWSIPFSNGGGY